MNAKKPKIQFLATLIKGTCIIPDPLVCGVIQDIYGVNTELQFEVSKPSKKRSNPQNAYYRGVVVVMIYNRLVELGIDVEDADQTHDLLRFTFLSKTVTLPDAQEFVDDQGEIINRPRIMLSTAKLDTIEFSAYLEKCRRYAAERLGIDIPDPNGLSAKMLATMPRELAS